MRQASSQKENITLWQFIVNSVEKLRVVWFAIPYTDWIVLKLCQVSLDPK